MIIINDDNGIMVYSLSGGFHAFISLTTILSEVGQIFNIFIPKELEILEDLLICSWFYSKEEL